MSITDELRIWAHEHLYTSGIMSDLLAIADRIDEEYETRVAALQEKVRNQRDALTDARLALEARNRGELKSRWQRELDALKEELADLRSRTVELPVDADGVPIRVGDMMKSIATDTKGKVTSITSNAFFIDYGCTGYRPIAFRHYNPPTTEDVLRQLCADYLDVQTGTDSREERELFAEYAKRLQLREVDG